MKVALLKSNISAMGGAERVALRLSQAFAKQGHHLQLITSGDVPAHLQNANYWVASCGKKKPLSFAHTLQFDTFCQQVNAYYKPDIIFSLDRNSLQTHLRASNGVHKEYLKARRQIEPFYRTALHAVNPLHNTLIALEKKAFTDEKLEQLIVNSYMVKKEILDHYKVNEDKIAVVHNGIDLAQNLSYFVNQEAIKSAFIETFQLDPARIFIGFIGHNYDRKGLAPLMKTLARAQNINFQLLVAGKEKNPDNYRALAKKLGIESRVSFLGAIPESIGVMATCDYIAIPSLYDPFANVTLEALSFGCFVLTTKRNGGAEALLNDTGAIIPFWENQDEAAAMLETLVTHKKDHSSAAKIRASIESFSLDEKMQQIVELCTQRVSQSVSI